VWTCNCRAFHSKFQEGWAGVKLFPPRFNTLSSQLGHFLVYGHHIVKATPNTWNRLTPVTFYKKTLKFLYVRETVSYNRVKSCCIDLGVLAHLPCVSLFVNLGIK
jgi:hypothetical protein